MTEEELKFAEAVDKGVCNGAYEFISEDSYNEESNNNKKGENKKMSLFERIKKVFGFTKKEETINYNQLTDPRDKASEPISAEEVGDIATKTSWSYVIRHYILPLEIIESFKDDLDWALICTYQTLTEEFIEKYQDMVNWNRVSSCQTLSEDFIRRFKDKVNWNNISSFQTLSDEFIVEFIDKVNVNFVLAKQKLSKKLRARLEYSVTCEEPPIVDDLKPATYDPESSAVWKVTLLNGITERLFTSVSELNSYIRNNGDNIRLIMRSAPKC